MGNSLAVQWLGLCAFTAEGAGSIPGWELRSHSHVACPPSPPKKKGKEGNFMDVKHPSIQCQLSFLDEVASNPQPRMWKL